MSPTLVSSDRRYLKAQGFLGVVPHLGFAEALAALRAGDAERLRALLRPIRRW
jgi:hypothetical protein